MMSVLSRGSHNQMLRQREGWIDDQSENSHLMEDLDQLQRYGAPLVIAFLVPFFDTLSFFFAEDFI